MKRIIYISFFLLCSSSLFAQSKLDSALQSLKDGELKEAKRFIDAATIQDGLKDSAASWYFSGNIYKALFLAYEADNKNSPFREKAVSDFQKSIELDFNEVYTNNSRKNLRYLAETIYNHAAQSFNTTSYPVAISNYKKYKHIMSLAYPETNFREKDITHQLALANTYEKIAKEDPASADMYTKKIESLYLDVLTLDSNNIKANYNLGIIFYNKGVEIIKNTDYSIDLEELSKVQDRTVKLFKQALPYMLKAYELNPKKKEILLALQGIYVGLNNKEMFNKYKEELLELHEESNTPEEENNTPPK